MTKTFQNSKQCQPTPIVSALSLERVRIVTRLKFIRDGKRQQSLKTRFFSQSLMGTLILAGDLFQWARFCNDASCNERTFVWPKSIAPCVYSSVPKSIHQTLKNNTENMLQVTLLTISAISIDNEASDLWLFADFVLFWFKKRILCFFPILVKWQISVKSGVHTCIITRKCEIAQIFYDWFDNLKDVLQRLCEN